VEGVTGVARVAEALRRAGADCEVIEVPSSAHSASEAAAALGCSVAQIVKSLIFRAVASDTPVLVLVSGARRVDVARLAELVGEAVEQAAPAFVVERTGYAVGGVPPLGHDNPIVSYLDTSLLEFDRVWAAAGSANAVFSIEPRELIAATSAKVVAT